MLEAAAHWLSDLPTILAVIVSIFVGASLSALGLVAAHSILPHGVRSAHNDVSGFTFATVGVIYAVLLAFVAVVVWQNFAQTENQVQTEANLVGDLYRDTPAFPEPAASRLRHYLFVYAEIVVEDEWPSLAAGRIDETEGWQLLDKFHTELLQVEAKDESFVVMRADAVETLNALSDARRGRFHAASLEMPAIYGGISSLARNTDDLYLSFRRAAIMDACGDGVAAWGLDRPRHGAGRLTQQSISGAEPRIHSAIP